MKVNMCHHFVVSHKISAAEKWKNSSVHWNNLSVCSLCSLCLLSQLQTRVPYLSFSFSQHWNFITTSHTSLPWATNMFTFQRWQEAQRAWTSCSVCTQCGSWKPERKQHPSDCRGPSCSLPAPQPRAHTSVWLCLLSCQPLSGHSQPSSWCSLQRPACPLRAPPTYSRFSLVPDLCLPSREESDEQRCLTLSLASLCSSLRCSILLGGAVQQWGKSLSGSAASPQDTKVLNWTWWPSWPQQGDESLVYCCPSPRGSLYVFWRN